MRQDLYENLSLDEVAEHFDEITALADSVSLFTEWHGPRFEQLWLKRRSLEIRRIRRPHRGSSRRRRSSAPPARRRRSTRSGGCPPTR